MLVRKCFGCQLCPLQAIFMGSGMPAVNAISGGWLVYVRAPGAVLGAGRSGGGWCWGGGGGGGGGGGRARRAGGGGEPRAAGESPAGGPRGLPPRRRWVKTHPPRPLCANLSLVTVPTGSPAGRRCEVPTHGQRE